MTDLSEVLKSLSSLRRSELEEVKKRATFLLQHSMSVVESVEEEDWLLYGIMEELKRRGLHSGGDFRIRHASSHAGFQSQSERVRALLLEAVPGLSLSERRLLGMLAAESLATYISKWRPEPREVSRDNLLRYVGKVPEAIDSSFPDYLSAGMLASVLHHRASIEELNPGASRDALMR
ncbi:MAG: hypothetical protein KGO96_10275 [Elusimicrobia bacterium]|nr:hypothetical protein [Elusimicrobiota bacterium]